MTFPLRAAFTAAAAALAALPADAASEPPLTVGKTFIAGGLDPAEGSAGWALVSHGVAEQLFTVSRTGEVVPQLARTAERTDALTWEVRLAEDRAFSDGREVTALTVAEALNRTSEANPAARASAGHLEATATGAHTLTVETERPTPVLGSVLAEWPMAIYRMTDEAPVFTGPYAVADFEAGAQLELTANPHFPRAEERPDVRIVHVPDAQSLALGMMAGELDLAFHLPAEMRVAVAARDDLHVRTFPVEYQYMMWMNTERGPLADARLRRAIDRAIDRDALATAAGAGVPATGAFAQRFPFAADPGPGHDPAEAARLLDEAGWTVDDAGQRTRDGELLELTLWAYPQRPDLITFQPVIRSALADLGIAVETRVSENPSSTAEQGDFDLFLWAQHTAPAGDPGFFLSLFLSEDGSNNHTGWSNTEFEAVLATLSNEGDSARRAELAIEAQSIVAEEAPVAFLLTPEWHVGVSDGLAGYEPWGSDYYVIRADFALDPAP